MNLSQNSKVIILASLFIITFLILLSIIRLVVNWNEETPVLKDVRLGRSIIIIIHYRDLIKSH